MEQQSTEMASMNSGATLQVLRLLCEDQGADVTVCGGGGGLLLLQKTTRKTGKVAAQHLKLPAAGFTVRGN